MHYYIEISSWNLLESFVTESISPFAFYGERNFGNNLSRFLSGKKEKYEFLILSTEDLGGDFSICVDGSLIDKDVLNPIKGLKTGYTYPKTIYYKKGAVQFRFASPELRDSMIAESHILLEVKCIEKYSDSFFIEKKEAKNVKEISSLGEAFSFEKATYIKSDNQYNKIKGAIVGYARGLFTTSDASNQLLQNELRKLKNSFGGLNTHIMMNDSFNNEDGIIECIENCKQLYFSQIESTNSFDVIMAQYAEIKRIALMRVEEFKNQELPTRKRQKENLLIEKTTIENQLSEIERRYNIVNVKNELEYIKAQEKKNGEKVGKSRQYFKKGSAESNRKQQLKAIISDFENSNEEYKKLKFKLSIVEQQLIDNPEKYDATLSAIFLRISDILNDLIKKSAAITNEGNMDLSKIELNQNSLTIKNSHNDAEICYFNILLNCIIESQQQQQLSEFYILQLLEESAQKFKGDVLSEAETGQRILNCLREFWKYKNQRIEQFDIPNDMPILQSIMSFYVKPLGFDQIERYMLINKFIYKEYAFMLWGICIGFADMPKTFTNVLFQNTTAIKLIENKLNEL